LYRREPYRDEFYFIEPRVPVSAEDAKPFDCRANAVRDVRQTKGLDYDATTEAGPSCCGPEGCP